MLLVKEDKSLYHIHIPRTAGRHVSVVFVQNGFEPYYCNFQDKIGGIGHPHLHYPLYNFLPYVDDAIKFTVVRDPFTKFLSAVNVIYKDRKFDPSFIDNLENESFLINFIEYELQNDSFHNNWFRPQNEFISDETLIYKFENGMEDNFYHWIKKNLNIKITKSPHEYQKMDAELDEFHFNLSDKVRNIVYEFYKEDCLTFDYHT